ncbi:MAG: DUF4348 domain-containing protein [Saprospiraceae bacterium]|nr:DUF4348 domain-containing protein [Saprospiraceae bacterium]
MGYKPHVAFWCCILLFGCSAPSIDGHSTHSTNDDTESETDVSILAADRSFQNFLKHFNEDADFQKKRTRFPLAVAHYDIANDEMDTMSIAVESFQQLDLSKENIKAHRDEWTLKVVLHQNKIKAVVEIRGVDTGIFVDYHFEKQDGRWMLVFVEDSST